MIKILFICHGNICRSPMAEFLFKDKVEKAGLADVFEACSSATSNEEIGNPVHYGAAMELSRRGISAKGKRAVRLSPSDADKYDYFLCMDTANVQNAKRILGKIAKDKVFLLLGFAGEDESVADPWYTGDFRTAFADIERGIDGFLKTVL